MKKTVVQRTAEKYSREETEAMFELAFGTEPDRAIVIYEDVIAGFTELTAEEIGLLILAARDYITDGIEPVFADRTMRYSWANFRKNLVYSTNLYRIKEIQAQYAHSKELHKQHKSLEEYLCFLHDCSNFGSPEITRSQQKSDDFNITESNITKSNTTEQKQNETKIEQNTNSTETTVETTRVENRQASKEEGERGQAFSRAQFMKDLEAEFAEDNAEDNTQDADVGFGEESGDFLGDVEEPDAESESVVDEPKPEVVCNPNTTQSGETQKSEISSGNVIVFAMNHANAPKQKIYAEPEEGESEEEFQERRRKEMIAKLMGSMPQEQTEYCAQRLSNIKSIGELPVQRTVS